jgi:2-polyprenyl-3-methyl-5-hydroxy-6-metoxy-1,4-benzoquinol methylase
VLEIGTASGYMGEYLIHEKQCDVWGVEPVQSLYRDASTRGYTKLWAETAEEFIQKHAAEAGSFDVIFLADVLEHMSNPEEVLRRLKEFLKPGGKVIIWLPNIAHYSIRKSLICGKFDMQDSGILDRTHFHFFTKKTAIEMIQKAGFIVQSARPCSGSQERLFPALGYPFKFFIHHFPGFFAIQFIYIANPN